MPDIKDYNSELIETFRATRAAAGNPLDGRALLLLTTIGARTGLPRVTPLVSISIGDRLFIVASSGGSQFNPAWYHNLLANPEVTVEFGPDTFQATASVDRPRQARPVGRSHKTVPILCRVSGPGRSQNPPDRTHAQSKLAASTAPYGIIQGASASVLRVEHGLLIYISVSHKTGRRFTRWATTFVVE